MRQVDGRRPSREAAPPLNYDPTDPTGVRERDKLLHDVFLVGVADGIRQWATVWSTVEGLRHRHLFEARITDIDRRASTVNRTTMVRGMLAAAFTWRDRIPWSTELPPTIFDDYQGWEFNAFDADCVIQLGIYGDLPYTERRLRRRGIIPSDKTLDKPGTV